MDNSRELFGAPLAPLEFELDDGPAIEALLAAYPDGIEVSELPHSSEEIEGKLHYTHYICHYTHYTHNIDGMLIC